LRIVLAIYLVLISIIYAMKTVLLFALILALAPSVGFAKSAGHGFGHGHGSKVGAHHKDIIRLGHPVSR
jgi:hypothetical protein